MSGRFSIKQGHYPVKVSSLKCFVFSIVLLSLRPQIRKLFSQLDLGALLLHKGS